ncbi:MAG: sigma-70 family RNA polymerase sigma factor [Luteitalea sp.]|nr:sigma-70 family RNA polymerase sigma factor [Luteitalea sp.]
MDADRTLVAEAAAGSREAFDELVRRYQARIYGLARTLTGGDPDAEDLVQETFVRAFRAVGDFRCESSFHTWLYRIAVNVMKSHLERRRRLDSVTARPAGETFKSATEQLPSVEDLEATVARRQAIDRALASLPEELRIVITLRDVQGLEYREIATITHLPMGTVESRLFRARQRLRPLLEPLLGSASGGRGPSAKRRRDDRADGRADGRADDRDERC